jgi:hypothetical protein
MARSIDRKMARVSRLLWLAGLVFATAFVLTLRGGAGRHAPMPTAPRTDRFAKSPRNEAPLVRVVSGHDLESACGERAQDLRGQLGGQFAVLVRTPWVLASDLDADTLQRKYEQVFEPAWRAMADAYFQSPPDKPITVLLFSTEACYRRWAERLFVDRHVSRFGYYKPGRRTILVNVSEGEGPLLHELTHALMACDLPDAPPWFEEGLAALHETSRLEAGPHGPRLKGLANWRLDALRREVARERLRSLDWLRSVRSLAGPDEAVCYAYARYVCMFLQDEGILGQYYQRLRVHRGEDKCGEQAWYEVFPQANRSDLDARFRRWLLSLPREDAASTLGSSGPRPAGAPAVHSGA